MRNADAARAAPSLRRLAAVARSFRGSSRPGWAYPRRVAMQNKTGWHARGRASAGTSGLRRTGINLIILGAFALVAAGAASAVSGADLPMDLLALVGILACLAGWRVMVVGRRREQSSD